MLTSSKQTLTVNTVTVEFLYWWQAHISSAVDNFFSENALYYTVLCYNSTATRTADLSEAKLLSSVLIY